MNNTHPMQKEIDSIGRTPMGGASLSSAARNSGPQICVLMSAYNAGALLRESVDSVLRQSFPYFKLLIINDGSDDGCLDAIHALRDPRISIVDNERNIGLAASLNLGIALCDTPYIARMDADDIAHSDRFRFQIDYMERHPELLASGTSMKYFGSKGAICHFPTEPEDIEINLLFQNCICHPSIIIRREALSQCGEEYSLDDHFAEDYGLWTRLVRHGKLGNIDRVLYFYRWHSNQVSQKKSDIQYETSKRIIGEYFMRSLGISLTSLEADIVALDANRERIVNLRLFNSESVLLSMAQLFDRIIDASKLSGRFNQKKLVAIVEKKYQNVSLLFGKKGREFYLANPIAGARRTSDYLKYRLRMFNRSLRNGYK